MDDRAAFLAENQRKMYTAVVVSLIVAAQAQALQLLPEGSYLVRGIVTNQGESGPYLVADIQIEHVYNAGDEIVGRHFSANTADEQTPGSVNRVIVPRLRIGESGLWLLQQDSGPLRPRSVYVYNYVAWPVIKGRQTPGGPRFEAVASFAETLERVSQIRGRDVAISELKRLTTDSNPHVSSWAISRVAAAAATVDDGLVGFLTDLVRNTQIPVQGQVELDRAQVELRRRDWARSDARLKLFLRWFVRGVPNADAYLVAEQLGRAAQHPATAGFTQPDLLLLTTLLAENARFPLSARKCVGSILRSAVRSYDDDRPAFEAALKMLDARFPAEVRRSVALAFVHDLEMDDECRERLTKLRDIETDKSVLQLLSGALARPDGKPRRAFVPQGQPSYLKRREPFCPPNAQ